LTEYSPPRKVYDRLVLLEGSAFFDATDNKLITLMPYRRANIAKIILRVSLARPACPGRSRGEPAERWIGKSHNERL